VAERGELIDVQIGRGIPRQLRAVEVEVNRLPDYSGGLVQANDINSLKAKEWGRSEKMSVVRIHFLESILGGAGQMEGIGASKEHRYGRPPENFFQPVLNAVGER